MIPIKVHIQNVDGDGGLYDRTAADTLLPAMPRKGDVVYMSEEISRQVIGAILKEERLIRAWRNLIVMSSLHSRAFMSLQENFYVEDAWFDTRDNSAHILMTDNVTRSKVEIDDALVAQLRKSFEEGLFWY